jgi:glucan biosynthesis protein C
LSGARPGYVLTVIVLLLYLTLISGPDLFIPVSTSVFPPLYIPTFYFLFFMAGYYLYLHRMLLSRLSNIGWVLLLSGILLFCGLFYYVHRLQDLSVGEKAISSFILVLEICLLVAGFIGVFLHYFKRELFVWRYISDASYWMYLVHMFLVAALQVLFIYSDVAGWLRFPLVLGVTFFISMLTYGVFIRYSIIGRYLHGARKRMK